MSQNQPNALFTRAPNRYYKGGHSEFQDTRGWHQREDYNVQHSSCNFSIDLIVKNWLWADFELQ